jgi:hypothetical protein
MKKQFKLLSVAIILAVLSSCTGKGGIPDVKLIPVKSGAEFEYIDKEGKIVINPQFGEASVFRNGIALVKTSGKDAKWGYIDETGKYLINAQYKYATIFNEGLAWVVIENAAPTAINEKGEIKITLQNAEEVRLFSEGLAAFSTVDKDGKTKWGFIDKNGNVKINPQFAQVGSFKEGKCAVSNDDRKWGYIDDNGKISINYQFDNAQVFSNGKAVVSSDDKYGVIGKDGKYIINPQFKYMFADGEWFAISQNDKWGWCDTNGKIVINPQFANIYLFNNNKLAPIQSGDQWGYIDKEGKMIINPQFKAAISFNGNLALVFSSDKIGFINEEGKYIINPQFSGISYDYIQYLRGGTMYESVVTDFFNVEAVTNAIDLTNPEGFSFNSTFDEVMKKLNLPESSFSQNGYQHTVIGQKKITNDVSYSFSVSGSAYEAVNVTSGSGWYTYNTTEYKFRGGNKVIAYSYNIYLNGKGYGKGKTLIESFISKLSGFNKGKNSSANMYFDKKTKITFSGYDNVVTIGILPVDGTEVIDNDTKMVLSSSPKPIVDGERAPSKADSTVVAVQ